MTTNNVVDSLKRIVETYPNKPNSGIKPNKFPLTRYTRRGYQLEPVDYHKGEKIQFR